MANPVRIIPAGYREVHYLKLTQTSLLIWLNLLSLIPLVMSGLLVFGLLLVYHEELGAVLVIDALPDTLPMLPGLVLTLLVLPLHEWIHGQMIKHVGHEPRYGVKWMVLFATSKGGVFRRNEFIDVALAPLVVITSAGIVLMLFLPLGLAQWVGLAIVMNAAGAIGDLWMTVVALRYDRSVLVRDEEDSMRIFATPSAQDT